jgi:hypothetical protein
LGLLEADDEVQSIVTSHQRLFPFMLFEPVVVDICCEVRQHQD